MAKNIKIISGNTCSYHNETDTITHFLIDCNSNKPLSKGWAREWHSITSWLCFPNKQKQTPEAPNQSCKINYKFTSSYKQEPHVQSIKVDVTLTKAEFHKCILVYKCRMGLAPQYSCDMFIANNSNHFYNTKMVYSLELP